MEIKAEQENNFPPIPQKKLFPKGAAFHFHGEPTTWGDSPEKVYLCTSLLL
jgi:hypothetical protein